MPLVIGLMLLGIGSGVARRHFIRAFFRDAPAGAPPPVAQPAAGQATAAQPLPAAAGLPPAPRTRVLLIDGLDADTARNLPALNHLCRDGLDLTVDVGFPTVSLPVQSVLWTGRTQHQSGLLYRIAPLATPPPGALPHRLPGSRAASEDQPFIARSFGFQMLAGDFPAAAREAVSGSARLAFVHVLRVDKAGHRGGSASAAYREAAVWSDDLLGKLLRTAPAGPGTRWFVLSDHGHRGAGGHGGAEREIRLTRACIAGGPSARRGDSPGSEIHLIDLARALGDSLGLPPPAGAVGRPLPFARAHPDRGATLPGAGWLRQGLAVLVFLGALALGLARPRWRRRSLWPLWPLPLPLAYLGVLVIRGLPTLSNPIVYPPLGIGAVLAAVPGLLLLVVAMGWLLRHDPGRLPDFCRVQLVPLAGLVAACLLACGGVQAIVRGGPPPLYPIWTAHAAVFMSLFAAAALLLALVLLLAVAGSFALPLLIRARTRRAAR